MMKRRLVAPAVVALLACATLSADAQDRRHVTEPRVPPVCSRVDARIPLREGRITEADEATLDTARIQAAIDACLPGLGVELRPSDEHRAFISGPLELRTGVALIVAPGATLFASRNPREYDAHPGSCGVVDQDGRGCRPLIHAGGTRDAAVIGEGVIDGRGGATLIGQTLSWWDLAEQARIERAKQNVPRLVVAEQSDNFVLYRITLRNSPNFHVMVSRTRGFTAWGVTIDAPATARNTDGIDPSSSSDVTIINSTIRCGDDNVAIKAGSAGPADHVSVIDNHFYSGHGMSIGSETNGGVSAIEVRNLTIDGADNGLRIKSNRSRGGIVRDVLYAGVCIRNVKNPLVVDSFYDHVTEGPLVPSLGPIRYHDVRIAGGGVVTIAGADRDHPANLILDGVATDAAPIAMHVSNARIRLGPGRVDLNLEGLDAAIRGTPGDRPVPSCRGAFIPFLRK